MAKQDKETEVVAQTAAKNVTGGSKKGKAAPAKKAVAKGSKATKAAGSKTAATKKAGSKKSQKTGSKTAKKSEDSARFFKLIDPKTHKPFGRYTGDTPKQAASKGYTKLLQKYKEQKKTAPKEMTIYLRESTRGSNRKVYGYSAIRQKLPEPQELSIKDKETGKIKVITYNYRNKIKKVAVPEQLGGALKKVTKKAGSKTAKKAGSKAGSKKATPAKKAAPAKKAGSKTAAPAKKVAAKAGSKTAAKKAVKAK
jgi:hypothetical protein